MTETQRVTASLNGVEFEADIPRDTITFRPRFTVDGDGLVADAEVTCSPGSRIIRMTKVSRGNWFITFTGRRFFPLDPSPAEVDIADIAHALANVCRFGGHVRRFYSVAEHSVHCSRLVPHYLALSALMHDAAEAYVGDVIRPLKRVLPSYAPIERAVEQAIAKRYRLPPVAGDDKDLIKLVDSQALMRERVAFVAPHDFEWVEDEQGIEAADFTPEGWTPERAEREFTGRWLELHGA